MGSDNIRDITLVAVSESKTLSLKCTKDLPNQNPCTKHWLSKVWSIHPVDYEATMTYHLTWRGLHSVLLGGLKQDAGKCVWYNTIFIAQRQRNLYLSMNVCVGVYLYLYTHTHYYLCLYNCVVLWELEKLCKTHSRL